MNDAMRKRQEEHKREVDERKNRPNTFAGKAAKKYEDMSYEEQMKLYKESQSCYAQCRVLIPGNPGGPEDMMSQAVAVVH